MKLLFLILTCSAVHALHAYGQVAIGFAANFMVPPESTNQDGNAYSLVPFYAKAFRYQQVYVASEFVSLTNYGGGWLFDIYFRGDATNGTSFGVEIPDIQLNFSTTRLGPDELSTSFADNVGTDDSVIFSGHLQTSASGGHASGPESFSFNIPLSRMFFYDPSAGNLLLDIRIFQGYTNSFPGQPILDGWNRTNDAVSRVIAANVNDNIGSADTIGLATWLFFWPNPKLHVQQETNSVVLTWPANPDFFLLQENATLSAQSIWQPVTNGITRIQNGFVKAYQVPLTSARTESYFRLVSTSSP